MTTESTEQYVSAAQHGDERAFAALIEAHYGLVRALAYSTVRERCAAEDVTQEVFLVAWSNLDRLRNHGAFPMWLRKIARHTSLNWIRSESFRKKLAERYGKTIGEASGVDAPERRERARRVQEALATLTPLYREAMVLFYMEGQSVRDAARELGITEGAMKLRLHQGRKRLRALLEADLEQELIQEVSAPTPARAVERIASALMIGPAMPSLGKAAAAPGIGLWLHETMHSGLSQWPRMLIDGGVAMSTKKAVIAGAVALVLGLGGYIGFSMRGGEGEIAPKSRPRIGIASVRPKEAPLPATVSPLSAAAEEEEPTATSETQTEPEESLPKDAEIVAAADAGTEEEPGKIKDPKDYASVSGVVIDSKGYPLPGALVRVLATGSPTPEAMGPRRFDEIRNREDHAFTGTTDDNGAFSIAGISYEGMATASASAAGYTFGPKSQEILQLSPRTNLDNLRLILQSGVTINGRLLSSAKRPVADGAVSIQAFTDGQHTVNGTMQSAGTDEHGLFRLTFPNEGQATLTASSPTYGDATFSEVNVSDEGEVELTMEDPASVSGRIEWSDGSPAAGVTVALLGSAQIGNGRSGPGHSYSGGTDANGGYVIDSVDVGQDYRVAVQHGSDRPLSQILPFGALRPGEQRVWDYKIEVPIVVHGVVYGESTRKPLTAVKVSCRKDGVRLDATVPVGPDGAYELRLLSGEGNYLVYPRYWRQDFDDRTPDGESLTLRPGDEVNVDLYLPDTFTMAFAVVDLAGDPVPGVELMVSEGDHNWALAGFAVTDAEGRWVWEGFIAGVETRVIVLRDGKRRASSESYVGEPGEIVPEQVLVMRDYGGIEGDAVDQAGNPLANVPINFEIRYGNDSIVEAEQRTDENGHFVLLDDVPATLVQVLASATINRPDFSSTLDWDSGPFLCPADMVVDLGAAAFSGAVGPSPEAEQNKLLARVP